MKTLLLSLVMIAITSLSVNAQWQQTSLDSTHVRALAINGNSIFVGTYGDGLFLSSNNGSSWSSDTSFKNPFVTSFAINGGNIFAGSNFCSVPFGLSDGVFLSSNNGISWMSKNVGLTDTTVLSLAISDTDIFAGTSGGGVFFLKTMETVGLL